MRKRVIIDTDPGCDDAVAIIIALNNSDKVDIRLISSVGGNVAAETCANNACFIVDNFSDKQIPVFIGEESRFGVEAKNVHGESGLGNVKYSSTLTIPKQNSIEEMYKEIISSDEKIIILGLGACTNTAKLLKLHPDCKDKIEYISLMAASMNGMGNITPYAEFNVYANPEAFDYVLKSGVNLVFSPMELGIKCSVKKSSILNREITSKKEQVLHDIIDGAFEPGNPDEFYIFDAQVTMGLLFPEFYEFKNCNVTVDLSEEKLGQTFFELTENETNMKVQIAKDVESIKNMLVKELYR